MDHSDIAILTKNSKNIHRHQQPWDGNADVPSEKIPQQKEKIKFSIPKGTQNAASCSETMIYGQRLHKSTQQVQGIKMRNKIPTPTPLKRHFNQSEIRFQKKGMVHRRRKSNFSSC